MSRVAATVQDVPALPRDEDGPVFKEPWEAHAFALAVRLSEAGCFSWPEWVAALAREIGAASAQAEPEQGDCHYQHWLRALEGLCIEKGFVNGPDLRQRQEEWRLAYLHTPHGRPVELSAAVNVRHEH